MSTPRIFDSRFVSTDDDVSVCPSRPPFQWGPFIGLVNDLQAHLVRSKSTRAAYLKLLANFHDSSAEARALRPQPTDEEVMQYFQDSFPHVHITGMTKHPSSSSIGLEVPRPCHWREKGEDPNEIFSHIYPITTMLRSHDRERDPKATTFQMSQDTYTIIVAVILLDALRYPLIKHFFGPILPVHYGPHVDSMAAQQCWPDWDIQHSLFGFHVTVECKPGAQDVIRDMTTLLAETHGKSYVLNDPQEFRCLLASFKDATLHTISIANAADPTDPLPGALREHIESAFCSSSALYCATNVNRQKAMEGVKTVRGSIGRQCRREPEERPEASSHKDAAHCIHMWISKLSIF